MRVRIYYKTNRKDLIREIQKHFKTTVSVNYESEFTTDELGLNHLRIIEKQGLIKIRSIYET